MKISLNQIVEVKLTEAGKEQYIKYHENLLGVYKNGMDKLYKTLLENIKGDVEGGRYKAELWKLMEVFGSMLRNGGETPFENMEIYIEASEEVYGELVYPSDIKK